jgi:hypothetical protein
MRAPMLRAYVPRLLHRCHAPAFGEDKGKARTVKKNPGGAMQIISYAWTLPALLARRKTRTRRQWIDSYASRFKVGMLCAAYDKSPRFRGKKVGVIRITGLKKEDIALMPDADYEREGFAYFAEQGLEIWRKPPRRAFDDWRAQGGTYWVVDFEIEELVPNGVP